jgi:hypothetical protein
MNLLVSRSVVLSSLFFGALHAFAGQEVGNGVPNYQPKSETAWFLDSNTGQRSIRYCQWVEPSFGASSAFTAEATKRAISTWKDYITSRHINERFSDPLSHLALNFQELSNCDGTEDLTLYFGVDNAETESFRAIAESPVAYAHRSKADFMNGWSKGFIWVSKANSLDAAHLFPNWSAPSALSAVLLHEFGHLFGCEHIEGTIMDEKLAIRLNETQSRLSTSIDQKNALFWTSRYLPEYPGLLGFKADNMLDPDDPSIIFKKLTGRNAFGNIHAKLSTQGCAGIYCLFISDDQGSAVFEIQAGLDFGSSDFWFGAGSHKFQPLYQDGIGHWHEFGMQGTGFISFGSLVSLTDTRTHRIIFSVNSSTITAMGPVVIQLLESDGSRHPLFSAIGN